MCAAVPIVSDGFTKRIYWVRC